MQLYYGADRIVEKPEYNGGKAGNDYGPGFYLTPDKKMARLWACKNRDGGYLITYDVDIEKLDVLDLRSATDENVLQWISLLVQHRFSKEEYESNRQSIEWLKGKYTFPDNADMIIGYRADDSYFAYSRDFVANDLSLEALAQAMRIGKLGLQYVLKSRKAFTCIRMRKYEKVEHSNEYQIFRNKALQQYRALKKEDSIDNTFIRDLMRKEK